MRRQRVFQPTGTAYQATRDVHGGAGAGFGAYLLDRALRRPSHLRGWHPLRARAGDTPTGPREPIRTLDLGHALGPLESESLRFNITNTGGGIQPVGLFNTLRRLAYAGSQRTRPTPIQADDT